MTTLEEALFRENENLTQMIKSERSEHESQKKALIEKYEKKIENLQQSNVNLIERMQHLVNDCEDKIYESSRAQRERYEKSLGFLKKKLISLQEEFKELSKKYESLKEKYQE